MDTEKLEHIINCSTETWRSPSSELTMSEPAPLILLVVYAGVGTKELADHIIAYEERVMQRGRPTVFDDWEKVESYETGARYALVKWFLSHIDQFYNTHILVASSLLKMGVKVANIAAGGRVQVYTNRDTFYRVFTECITKAKKIN
jgi:hypothetical protein